MRIISSIGAVCVSVIMVNHFGINPVSGGIPLNDSSIIGKITCIRGESELSLLNCVLFDCVL